MNEKKRKRNTSVAICLFLIMLAFVVNGVARLQNSEESATPVISNEQIHNEYELKLYEGYLAVFKKGNNTPVKITNITEHSLRNYDKRLLIKGISVSGDIELAKLLEDFGS